MNSCFVCGTLESKLCGGCYNRSYCGPICQKKDRKSHAKNCGIMTRKLDTGLINDQIIKMKLQCTKWAMHFGQVLCILQEENYVRSKNIGMTQYLQRRAYFEGPSSHENDSLIRWGPYKYYFNDRLQAFLRSKPKLGTLLPMRDQVMSFEYPSSTQLFRNTHTEPDVAKYIFGQNHVSIGFVDLQDLLSGEFMGNSELKTTFLMIDQDEITVARSMVIHQMILSDLPSIYILQCWYSTIWSKEAMVSFQNACKIILTQTDIGSNKVIKIIKNWSAMSRINKNKIVKDWYLSQIATKEMTYGVMLKKKSDQEDYFNYQLTGSCFITPENEFTGNLTVSLDKMNEFNQISNIFWVFPWESVEKKILLKAGESSMMKIMSDHLERKLANLKSILVKSNISCQFRCQLIDMSNPDPELVKEIKLLKPKTILWSNLPDYCNRMDFMSSARKMSSVNTINSFHIMNWSRNVYGTYIFDHQNHMTVQEFDKFYEKLKLEYFTSHMKWINSVNLNELIDLQNFFEIRLNITDNSLCRKYHEKYLNNIFQGHKVDVIYKKFSDRLTCFSRASSITTASFQFLK